MSATKNGSVRGGRIEALLATAALYEKTRRHGLASVRIFQAPALADRFERLLNGIIEDQIQKFLYERDRQA